MLLGRSHERLSITALLVYHFYEYAFAQIRSSSDLNCDFSHECRWQNSSLSEGIGFAVVSDQILDDRFPMSDGRKENYFAYTTAPNTHLLGRTSLVSDLIECQLGGARLKFWHYFTGRRSNVEICMRSPPGSLISSNLHCYEVAMNRGQQWQLASVELPPMSQPMELLIKATFEPPDDLVAIDDITYEAILCENSHRGSSEGAGGHIDVMENSISLPIPTVDHQYSTDSTSNHLPMSDMIFPNPGFLSAKRHSIGTSVVPFPFTFHSHHRSSPTVLQQNPIDLTRYLPKPFGLPLFPVPRKITMKREKNILTQEFSRKNKLTSNCGFDCDFDTAHFCHYKSATNVDFGKSSSMSDWTLANKPVSNPLTGIQRDFVGEGWYAYAGELADATKTYWLESNEPFRSAQNGRIYTLQFAYYLAGVRGRLRVCFSNESISMRDFGDFETEFGIDSTADICPFEQDGVNMVLNSRDWRIGSVKIPLGRNKIYFLADRLPKNYIIGLDEIHLLEETLNDHQLTTANCASLAEEKGPIFT